MKIGFKDGSSHEKRFDMFDLVMLGFVMSSAIFVLALLANCVKEDAPPWGLAIMSLIAATQLTLTIYYIGRYFSLKQ